MQADNAQYYNLMDKMNWNMLSCLTVFYMFNDRYVPTCLFLFHLVYI